MRNHHLCTLGLLFGLALAASAQTTTRLTFATAPKGWDIQGVPGRPKAVFTCGYEDGTNKVLQMTADKATATYKSGKLEVDLAKTPIMRWRWKAVTLPTGADGSNEKLDDQAIGLYVSAGGMFSQKSVALRWETDPAKGADGRAKDGAGVVSIYWQCTRNKTDLGTGDGWYIDEANVADLFKTKFGEIPSRIGLGFSCNSQFTGTKAEALLDWVEFVPAP